MPNTISITFLRLSLVLALCMAAPVWAEDTSPISTSSAGNAGAWCQGNPEQCDEMKQRLREKCGADPDRCAQLKAKAEDWRKRCDADPKACEAKKARLRGIMERRASRGQSQ